MSVKIILLPKILSMFEKTANHSETDIPARSPEFTKLVRKSLEDIRLNKVAPWKEVWDETMMFI